MCLMSLTHRQRRLVSLSNAPHLLRQLHHHQEPSNLALFQLRQFKLRRLRCRRFQSLNADVNNLARHLRQKHRAVPARKIARRHRHASNSSFFAIDAG